MKKIVSLTIAVIAVLSVATLYLLRDPLPRFIARRSTLTTVREGERKVEDGYVRQAVQLTARSGLVVDLVVSRALADSGATLPSRSCSEATRGGPKRPGCWEIITAS